MTAQEQQMIQSLADRINGTALAEKDPDAELFLQQALGRNPDAIYILAQTTLVQQYALEQAQKQLAEARAQAAEARAQLDQQRQQAEQPRHASSFLGNLLGRHDDPPPPPQSYQQQYAPPQYAPAPTYVPPPPPYGYGQPQFVPVQSGGFLRSAIQTAAGVAAGALAFEGIESLMHGFGGYSGGGFGMGMDGGRSEEIINNYYGDAAPGEHKEQLSPDIEDRRGFDDAVDRDDHNYGRDDLLDASGTADGGDSGTGDAAFDGSSADDFAMDDSGDTGFDDGN